MSEIDSLGQYRGAKCFTAQGCSCSEFAVITTSHAKGFVRDSENAGVIRASRDAGDGFIVGRQHSCRDVTIEIRIVTKESVVVVPPAIASSGVGECADMLVPRVDRNKLKTCGGEYPLWDY